MRRSFAAGYIFKSTDCIPEALGGGIAECNRRIIAELRSEYERLKAIDCLHRGPESAPESENPA